MPPSGRDAQLRARGLIISASSLARAASCDDRVLEPWRDRFTQRELRGRTALRPRVTSSPTQRIGILYATIAFNAAYLVCVMMS